jgi:hypothetical protein
MYTGLTGGVAYPSLPNPMNTMPAPAYTANIDPGIVDFDSGGGLHGIQWTTYMVGAQYYFPGTGGRFWISGNVSHSSSDNARQFTGGATKIRSVEDWFDVNLFVDPTPAVRVGAEFANFDDQYVDGAHARNQRGQISGYFLF